MKRFSKYLATIFIFGLFFLATALFGHNVFAVTYDLVAPSGTLTRGQDVQFTITVDTGGQTISSTQIGMTYDSTLLEYVSTAPGDTFTTVSANVQDTGKLVFSGTSENGYSGSGTFAVVTFKLIAQAAGSTQLCVLFNPSETPTVQPTSPQATSLPKTGSDDQTGKGAVAGIGFLLLAGGSLAFINAKMKFQKPHTTRHKSLHK